MSNGKRDPRPAWTTADDQVIREFYGQRPVAEIGSLVGRSGHAVENRAWRLGFSKRGELRPWTDTDTTQLRDLSTHMDAPEIAIQLDRTEAAVRQRLIALGCGKQQVATARMQAFLGVLREAGRSPSVGFPHADGPLPIPLSRPADYPLSQKTFITESTMHGYFSVLDTPEQGYILGLLAADGNVSPKHPRFSVGLIAKDMRAVEFARDRLNPAARLSPAADGRMVLQVTSRQILADLDRVGIVPRKSHILTWPAHLDELQRPFLLGYFDGDGSAYLHRQQERVTPGWNACSGSEQFLIDMREYIWTATGVRLQEIQRRPDTNLWQVSVEGLGAVVLDEWLHQEGIGLARKRFPEHVLARYRD